MKSLFSLAALMIALAASAADAPVRIKLSTILPDGVPQDAVLDRLEQDFQKVSGGKVILVRSASGSKDGEATIVRKLNSGLYQAALLSVTGLADINPDAAAFQNMPLVFRSWEEVDLVREKLRPEVEEGFARKGFVVLFWADSGWVHYFSTVKAVVPEEFKKLKLWAWAGNPKQMAIMKSLGYQPVGLETGDLIAGFKNGMVTAAPLTPTFALAAQIQTDAPHVVDVKWAPISGACIVRQDAWSKIDPAIQAKLLELCEAAGKEIRNRGRQFHDDALKTLAKGPRTHVYTPTPEQMLEWDKLGAELSPRIRADIVPAGIYDKAQAVLKDFRAGKK